LATFLSFFPPTFFSPAFGTRFRIFLSDEEPLVGWPVSLEGLLVSPFSRKISMDSSSPVLAAFSFFNRPSPVAQHPGKSSVPCLRENPGFRISKCSVGGRQPPSFPLVSPLPCGILRTLSTILSLPLRFFFLRYRALRDCPGG